ncbi:MAG: T9SS type B sorting domain-containing protein [Lutibacter sp.]|nr:T9SS type B sorting domain-containing protein [Lutibacter sp.]
MKDFITILLLFCAATVLAQGEANFWFFGQQGGLNFNNGNAAAVTGSSINTNEGCASFSNASGNLLFYTDGIKVWNKNHNIMPNGTNLLGDPSSSQSAIIVPHPGNSNLFYIFTVGANDYDNDGNLIKSTDGLNCYTVDMSLVGGLGDVVLGSRIDLSIGKNAQWTEKVTSVKGADCNTFWVISLVNNTFVSYKIDLNGLNITPIPSIVNYSESDPRGYLKVSPDGKKLASAAQGNSGNLLLYRFDDTNGKVANDGQTLISNLQQDGQPYGVEFSPRSSKLYSATYNYDTNTNKLFQFDIESTNIPASKILIKSQIGFRGALQLAPNGKIYATVPPNYDNGTQFLDAINLPDEPGANCSYQENALNLGSGRAMQGLPPFIASLLLPVEITDGITTQNLNNTTAKRCLGENYKLTPINISGTSTYKWTFNGIPIGTASSSSLTLNNLAFSNAGIYKLEVENIDACGFRIVYKGEVKLEVYTPPTITKPTNIKQCDDNNDGYFAFDLHSLRDAEILGTQSATVFEVVYFTNQTDADANTNAIVNLYTNSLPYGTDNLIARIQNIQNPICYETASFTVQVYESPNPPATISNLTLCDSNLTGTDTDGIEKFNLKNKETEILNGQSATKFTIAYFRDIALTNPITSNVTSFQNTTANLQPIYVKIANNSNPACVVTKSFNLEVLTLPVINSTFTFKQCDEDGVADGFTDFNLNEANGHLTLGNTSLSVTYHLTLSEANSGGNSITASPFSNATQSVIFARIKNTNGCFRVAQVNLLVSSTSFNANYLKTANACDNDGEIDGFRLFNLAENSGDIIAQFPIGQNLSVSYYRNLPDAQLEKNEITQSQLFKNETAFEQTLYVRVESDDNGECFGFGPHLKLVVEPRPEFDLDESVIYCLNLPPITVSTFNPKGNYSYEWKNESGIVIGYNAFQEISAPGNYSVMATSIDGCVSFSKTIKAIPSIIATISQNDITVIDDSENNSITISIDNLGIGDYEFSFNDPEGNYQDEPYFENITPGIHTIYVQDKNNCGIAPIEVSVIGYPKFLTPNNDGHNDTWNVSGISENFYQSATVYIFDRFGKLITEIDLYSEGWNGLFNGNYLPATDYWFSVELIDLKGNIRVKKGHFSLIRR